MRKVIRRIIPGLILACTVIVLLPVLSFAGEFKGDNVLFSYPDKFAAYEDEDRLSPLSLKPASDRREMQEVKRHNLYPKENIMSELSELFEKRRSIRDFEDREVTLEIIKEIIRDSCLAPSSANTQPWRFIIVNNRGIIKSLSDESKKNLLSNIERDPDSPARRYEGQMRDPDTNVFYNAPCLVFIVGPKAAGNLHVNCALAACYFMFSALERGLGTCWIGIGKNVQDPELLKLIGMPRDHEFVAPIIVGYPKGIPNPSERIEPQILKVVS